MRLVSYNGFLPFLVFFLFTLPLQANESVTVLRVIDGDTLKIIYNGDKENIRLIGIDTPENRINKKSQRDAKRSGRDLKTITAMGRRAESYVKNLIKKGDTIIIEFDTQKRDKYRRLLGYVYLSDGKMLNEEIVKAGYAQLMTIPPNVKYADRFRKAYREAIINKTGLWSK